MFQASPVNACRLPPKPVANLTYKGIEYEPHGSGNLIARDSNSKKQLYTIPVYSINANNLKDVQGVFITKVQVHSEDVLLVKNENGQSFHVNVNTKQVTAL